MSLEMVIATPAPMGFSPVQASNRAVGPSSNTGQKSTLTAPIIDFCVVVIDSEKAKKLTRKMPLGDLVRYVFGTGSAIVVGPIQDRVFNFYPRSATMVMRPHQSAERSASTTTARSVSACRAKGASTCAAGRKSQMCSTTSTHASATWTSRSMTSRARPSISRPFAISTTEASSS
ncbi:hypothetical protein [Lysobacter soli]|uniref:hypothetical protein n=1 Tax=Lysobacter soli TaxID=453783 RepID=UPI001F1B5F2A|nr:hypothetical protein [Lysobacter soli]